jgi:hypothetical protein
MWGNDPEQDINITDDDFDDSIEQHGGAPPKKTRVLIAGLTRDQDELLQTVQYKTGLLAGRDSLYLATRQFIEEDDSDVKQPTKRQVGKLSDDSEGARENTWGHVL